MSNCPYQNFYCDDDSLCADCYWDRGRRTTKSIRFIQFFIIGLVIIFSVLLLFKWSNYQEQQIMSIDYCWDELGNHYVAPNYNCR